ncbi:FAD-dependent oxidoreductase, partial [Nocardia sp. NPDC058497]|uniref:FAD-dependent oxidoreductase n=1 Tax=Nocardia sp. NPDC058497 TaxID=3346529 RepID=UPI0036690C58
MQPGATALRGRRIAIVGAGIAGLACAYTLTGLGAIVEVYEARAALGGRILTLRDGDTLSGSGSAPIRLPTGQSVEAGAARIHPHQVTMDWARLLRVPLAPLVVRNDDALINLTDNQAPHILRQRDWWQDLRERIVRPDIRQGYPQLLADSLADREPHRTRRTLGDVGAGGGTHPPREHARAPGPDDPQGRLTGRPQKPPPPFT